MRNNATLFEINLWSRLKQSQLGSKFTRQHSIDCFILDFYCPTKRLAIELDGNQHRQRENYKYDAERTSVLNQRNIKVLRFWNHEISKDIDAVCEKIQKELKKSS